MLSLLLFLGNTGIFAAVGRMLLLYIIRMDVAGGGAGACGFSLVVILVVVLVIMVLPC